MISYIIVEDERIEEVRTLDYIFKFVVDYRMSKDLLKTIGFVLRGNLMQTIAAWEEKSLEGDLIKNES